jgi:hypothetical protein
VDLGAVRDALPVWDTGRAEVLEWEAVDPAFAQDHALEASGLAATADGLWLLLERAGDDVSGCVSRIWRLRRDGPTDASVVGDPIDIQLDDCAWRLTALEFWHGRLLGLKTQFPGERYEILEIDPAAGRTRVVLDLTDLLRSVRVDGWGNNVEGLAISDDGSMWMVGDNRVSGVVDDEQPPSWPDEKALLLRLPPIYALRAPESRPTSGSGQSAASCPPGR